MKLIDTKTSRTGDRLSVTATFRDRMRRPARVRVVYEPVPDGALPEPVIEGDAAEVSNTLGVLAEIAWANGWRPAGLGVMIDHMIKNFKLPRES
jgi:hypothetical protein